MTAEQLTRVVAAVVRRNGRFLVCQRPRHKRHGGLWEFPGGKVRPGESAEAAIRRELREELQVVVRRAGAVLLSVPDPGAPFVIDFLEVEIEGAPATLEHAALRWVSPVELESLRLAPGDRVFAAELARGRLPDLSPR